MITQKKIQTYVALREARHAHDRRSAALKKKEDELAKEITEEVRLHGGKDRTMVRHGFVLSVKTLPTQVRWREHCIELIGEDAAEQLPKATREAVFVEPVAMPPVAAQSEPAPGSEPRS